MHTATITFRLAFEPGDDVSTDEIEIALGNLAAVMEVQAEDGLYLAGSPEAEDTMVDGHWLPNNQVAPHIIVNTTVSEAVEQPRSVYLAHVDHNNMLLVEPLIQHHGEDPIEAAASLAKTHPDCIYFAV